MSLAIHRVRPTRRDIRPCRRPGGPVRVVVAVSVVSVSRVSCVSVSVVWAVGSVLVSVSVVVRHVRASASAAGHAQVDQRGHQRGHD
eukprot:gene6631-8244_t